MVTEHPQVRHRFLSETPRPKAAKASLANHEMTDLRPLIGAAIQRALSLVGWSIKEAAGHIGIEDPSQLSRWISGKERPHLDRLFGVEALRWPLVRALAEVSGTADIDEGIRKRRIA